MSIVRCARASAFNGRLLARFAIVHVLRVRKRLIHLVYMGRRITMHIFRLLCRVRIQTGTSTSVRLPQYDFSCSQANTSWRTTSKCPQSYFVR